MIEKLKNNKKKVVAGAIVGLMVLPEAFVGGVNWRSVFGLEKDHIIRETARSIGVLTTPYDDGSAGRCTAWVANQKKRYVVANGHCLNNETNDMKGATVVFGESNKRILCEKVLASKPFEYVDYLVLECSEDLPKAIHIVENPIYNLGDKLISISYNCNYYENSQCQVEAKFHYDCEITSAKFGLYSIGHNCSSIGGSSGSPIFAINSVLDPDDETKSKYVLQQIALLNSGRFFADERGTQRGEGDINGAIKNPLWIADAKLYVPDLLDETGEMVGDDSTSGSTVMNFFTALFEFLTNWFSKG